MPSGQTTPSSACTFIANTVAGDPEAFGGQFGAVRLPAGTITNCLFAANEILFAHPPPAGAAAGLGNVDVANCTFVDSLAPEDATIIDVFGDTTIVNCIVHDNTGVPIHPDATVTYSIVEGGFPGEGNIDRPPLFVGPDDYRLAPGSPGIDAASNPAVPRGVETDLASQPRFADDPDTEDTGVGPPPVVDTGAYEFQPTPCPADCTGDGRLTVIDFVCFQALWQEQQPYADCDANCSYNILDFVCYQQLFQAGCP